MSNFFRDYLVFLIATCVGIATFSVLNVVIPPNNPNGISIPAPKFDSATPTGAELALKDAQASPKGVISVIGLQPYRLLTEDTRQNSSFSVVPYSYGNYRVSSTPVNPTH